MGSGDTRAGVVTPPDSWLTPLAWHFCSVGASLPLLMSLKMVFLFLALNYGMFGFKLYFKVSCLFYSNFSNNVLLFGE